MFGKSILAKSICAGGMLLALVSLGLLPASAAVVNPAISTNLSLAVTDPGVKQTVNNPCIFYSNGACPHTPSGWDHTVLTKTSGGYDQYSDSDKLYTVGQIRTVLGGDIFNVGIDLNDTSTPQTFATFVMETRADTNTSWNQQFAWSSGTNPLSVSSIHNGTGESDLVLSGFNLSGMLNTDQVRFGVYMPSVNDGTEQFWLYNPAAVPLPAGGILLISGLTGLGFLRRRRRTT